MKMMKLVVTFFLIISLNSNAQNFKPIDSTSKIHFVIKNFGINTGGDLKGLKGNISFSPDDLAASNFNVSVEVSTIDTDNTMRDKSLVGDEYFEATKFPLLTITSTKIEKTNKTAAGFYYFTGSLTIKGITKAISFPFHAKEENNGILFTGNFDVNRMDFGLGQQSIVLGNQVAVTLSVFAKKN